MSDHTTNEPTVKLCECGCGQPAPLARQNEAKRGYIKGEPTRFVQGHHNKVRELNPIEKRFWAKVDKRGPDDCWLWTASDDGSGYGQLNIERDGKRYSAKATRISYEIHYGPIPEGMLVCHKCDERYPIRDTTYRRCVNPAHLFLGDYTDNIQDCYDKDRRKPPPGHGKVSEDHPSAIYNNEQIIAWRKDFPLSGMRLIDFAQMHGVPRTTMSSIIHRHTWTHLP